MVTDTSVPIKGRPPNLLEVIRDRGWLQGLQKPTKEELSPFIAERVFLAERYLHPPSRAPWPTSAADLREHARAALYSVVALWSTIPFTAVYVSAAAHTARYASLAPFSGNISALRFMAREGGIRSLWQGAVPLTIGHLVDEATYRLRLGRLPSAIAYLVVHLCEVAAVRKMCWDARYRLGGMAGWSFGPFANFVTGYLLSLVVNMSGVGYYLPLSSTRIWLMAHPFDTLAETVRLGSYWSSFTGLFRGVRASLWSLIPRLAIEFLALKLARKVINRAFGISSQPKSMMEMMMGGMLGGGAGGSGAMGGMPPGFEAMMGGGAGGAGGGGMPPGFPGMGGAGLGGGPAKDAPPPTAQITEPSSDINWVRLHCELCGTAQA